MFNDNFMDIICIICGIAAIVLGIYEFITGKAFGRDLSKVNKDKAVAFTKKEGLIYVLLGVVVILMSLVIMYQILPMIFYWIGLGIVIAAIVLDAVLAKKYLK